MYVSFFLTKIKMLLEARLTKHFLTLRAKEYILLISKLNFVTLLSLFRKRKVMFCLLCKKQLTYKYKTARDWDIHGFLCSDCHIEKTKEYLFKQEQEKAKLEHKQDSCSLCNKTLNFEIDTRKPRWYWNLEPGSIICINCFQKKQSEYDIKINFCSLCKNRMGFFRYNPKPKWQIQGQLCKECWDSTNKSKK
jgi:hypothetical protein